MTDKEIIERGLKGRLADLYEESQCELPELPKEVIEGKMLALRETLSFIDTFEVKEVDLDTDFGVCWGEYCDCGGNINDYEVAKHFFELGMAVSNKAQKGEEYDRQSTEN